MDKLLRHPFDPTGQNPDNLITKEAHVLKDMRFRAIAPYYGAFYGDTVELNDTIKYRKLIRNKDYVTAELLSDKTAEVGAPINGIILIINREVSNNIEITYQCLGGESFKNNESIENLLKVTHDDVISYSFLDINKKPTDFQPIFHLHNVAEIYGFDYIMFLLETIRNAVIWKKSTLCFSLIERIDDEFTKLTKDVINVNDSFLNTLLVQFKQNFKKEYYDIDRVPNLIPSSQYEGIGIANSFPVDMVKETLITLQTVSFFKETLYSFLISKSKTGIGYEHGLVGNPTKEYLANACNGARFFIDSYDIALKTNQVFDLTVFPTLSARNTKFSINKITNYVSSKGGLFMATNLLTTETYIGKISELGNDFLVEWKKLQSANITDNLLADLVNHLGDNVNPHRDKKENVSLDLLENLSIVTKADVLSQTPVRKYLTVDNLQLFMKGFMAGQTDNNVIKEDPDINVMKRFDIIFSNCGDNLVNSGSGVCNVDEVKFTFDVFTQRIKYRNSKRISENPEIKYFNPVIIEGFTKQTGNSLSTDHSTRSGVKLVNIPLALGVNQSWNLGTLYQGFRSGVFNYETTNPYYDTLLVIRGAKTLPSITGVIETIFIKSYETLLDDFGGVQGLADEFEFQMKRGDYLICFKAFNGPNSTATEQEILDFEKKEQVAKVEIFSTGYTFYLDIRSAIYEDYNFITLTEKNSPKVIPSIHYTDKPDNWFDNTREVEGNGLISTVLIGKVKTGNRSVDLEPDENYGVNTLINNFKVNPSRPGYVNGTFGMTPVKLITDINNEFNYPTNIEDLPKDNFSNGVLGINIENDKATTIFVEQRDLIKSINYNVFLDPFIDNSKIIRPLPYTNLSFNNPYATGNNSVGDTKYEAFIEYMKLGFSRANALDTVSPRQNSSKGTLTVKVKNPLNTDEEFIIDLTENVRLNRDLFKSLYDNFVNNPNRVKHWGQPKVNLPYTELIEIPKRFVNQYKEQYRIVTNGSGRGLEKTNLFTPENIEVDIIEVGRLESEYILADYEEVQYNALFNNVSILKKWRFQNLRPVINIESYVDGELFPIYPDVLIDRDSEVEKLVTIYSVIDVSFSRDIKYREQLLNALSFTIEAFNDLVRREIIITLPDGLYDEIINDVIVDVEDNYEIGGEAFSTFDIMFGLYDHSNHITYDRETRTIVIDLIHVGVDQQIIFFKHHLKYIQWNYRIELAPTIVTSVLYPVITEDLVTTSFQFISAAARNYGKVYDNVETMRSKFELVEVVNRKMVHEIKFNDSTKTNFKFVNVTVNRVIGYKEFSTSEATKAKFEFIGVTHQKIVNYVVYRNHEPDFIRSKFEFIGVEVKQVKDEL